MPRLIVHLLLSLALIVQGIGVACAYGPMPSTRSESQAHATASMPDSGSDEMAEHCAMPMPCPDCADDPGDNTGNQGCLHLSSLSIPDFLTPSVPRITLRDTHLAPAAVSLVEHRQVPPTPPPIA